MTDNGGWFEDLDRTGTRGQEPAAGRGTRFRATGLSLPAAAVGVLLVATIALGVGGFRPPTDDPSADKPVATGQQPTDSGADKDVDGGTKPATEGANDGDKDEPGAVEEPSKEPGPADTAVLKVILEAGERDGKVRLEWTACEADDVVAWKVVRSADETVAWPAGEDTLLVALEPDVHAYTDGKAPEGRKSWYRVFAVALMGGEYLVRCASDAQRVFVPDPEPTPKPTPRPTAKPAPDPTDKPDIAELELAIKLRDGHPLLDWSQCKSDHFDLYKVVASKDDRVKWPTGDNDWVAAAIGERDVTALWDKDAPAGRTLYYRVFCLDKGENGYRILAASPVRKVTTPEVDPGPKPEPVELAIEAGTEGGVVWLDWETCDSEGFVYYKVVRSRDDNPSYFPWTDGTELIGVIESPGGSAFEDHDVASGDTWFYRVQSIGKWNGEKVLLGQTRVVRVEVP
jgi:hypothetical protein